MADDELMPHRHTSRQYEEKQLDKERLARGKKILSEIGFSENVRLSFLPKIMIKVLASDHITPVGSLTC